MAHECPICYMNCHCGGDIDDMCFSGTEEEMRCIHCNEDDDDDDDDDDSTDPNDSRQGIHYAGFTSNLQAK